jgi:formylglycine-generating enzyme required for sulfatase activity
MRWILGWIVLCIVSAAQSQPVRMVDIDSGRYLPLFGITPPAAVEVDAFRIDATPVTHAQYLDFVNTSPEWRKSSIKRIFADASYLNAWTDDATPPSALMASPVTTVSWHAASAYCSAQGKRLPTVDEWEYVAMADATRRDARTDAGYNQAILLSYETPRTYIKPVGQSTPNVWGVYDLHGVVWEWTLDFNSILITGESRGGGAESMLFCASGAVGASDLMNYAAFMRYAFRSSVKASHTINSLGFRCAQDL